MAKHTGQGAIDGAPQEQSTRPGLWTRRNTSTGTFNKAKLKGGAFKGVRKEN